MNETGIDGLLEAKSLKYKALHLRNWEAFSGEGYSDVRERVMVATLGAEPQVITLALDALLQTKTPIAHVIVLHTLADREPVRSALARLREEFTVNRYYDPHILFMPHLLAGTSGPLTDVATPQEMDDAFQSLYTVVRQHKQAGRNIDLSIAGGRKTIALLAMAVGQILFESEDRVWYLLSEPSLVQTRSLHAPHSASVTLVQVPVAAWNRYRPTEQNLTHDFIQNNLSAAEREVVLLLLREGLSNAALAMRLNKSPKTIANQLSRIYLKAAQHFNLSSPPDRTTLLALLGRYS